MYYSSEQLQTLRQDYLNMFDSIIIKLEARKIICKTISASARAGKLVISIGAMALVGGGFVLARALIKNSSNIDIFATFPLSGISMLTFPLTATSIYMAGKATNDKMNSFVEKIDNRMKKYIKANDILINYFKELKKSANYNDLDFEQTILSFGNFYQPIAQKKSFVGINIVDDLMSDDIKYADIDEKDEILKKIEKSYRDSCLKIALLKERMIVSSEFNNFYRKTRDLYFNNRINFRRSSY